MHRKGTVDLDSYVKEALVITNTDNRDQKNIELFLGHTQAPTSSEREFNIATSHPFRCKSWIIAHNGVLSNFEELKKRYIPKHTNPVDSSIIPVIINMSKGDTEHQGICAGLSLLKGTFSLWIHNTITKNTYICRCGSTLYADVYKNEFSSIKIRGYEELKENILYILTKEGITEVGNFNGQSPFFIL